MYLLSAQYWCTVLIRPMVVWWLSLFMSMSIFVSWKNTLCFEGRVDYIGRSISRLISILSTLCSVTGIDGTETAAAPSYFAL